MTDVSDLYEPADDREPEPCEWYPAPEPVALDEVETAYRLADITQVMGPHTQAAFSAVPDLVAELRAARERIAEWEALETREEWAVTGGPSFPAEPSGPSIWPHEPGLIAYVNRHPEAQLWRRKLSVHPWEPISTEAPF